MIRILLIETATDLGSVSIAGDGKALANDILIDQKRQASELVPQIQTLLDRYNLCMKDFSAVAVSSGPGSYTGLRVGVSTAKGLCFGAGIPLISMDTLSVITAGVPQSLVSRDTVIVPMIDARRMEVYTAVYNASGERTTEIEAVVLDENTFRSRYAQYPGIIFTGNGAEKYRELVPAEYAARCRFLPSQPKAADMAAYAHRAYNEKKFEDVAYFEPFYLKDFIAASPSKKLEAVLHPTH